MAQLDVAEKPTDMDLPGLKLHRLKGKHQDTWAVSISGNWRLTFQFRNGDAYEVDLIDYH